jgi:predicted metal-dependent HD superfamily phosphohydrolase
MDQVMSNKEQDIIASLRNCWRRLAGSVTADEALAGALFEEIVTAYSRPERHYHRLAHIRQVLDTLAPVLHQAIHPEAVLWAAWFHDVVYDPRAADNEERSAAFAEQMLARLHVPDKMIAPVRSLILSTKTHQPPEDDFDSRLFLDADLAVLGGPEDQYNAYARAIRREYAWVPEPDYRKRRTNVLRGFLHRPRIYFTDRLFAEREQQARRNLECEIRALDAEKGQE